jgi:peptidoglycan/LPS O-acetylase OafA/YrhL
VIQSLVALGFFHAHPELAVLTVAVIVAALAFASWHLVEARFLKRRSLSASGLSTRHEFTAAG